MGRRLVIDLDGTLTIDNDVSYPEKLPNLEVISKVRDLKAQGFEIVVFTARNMRTFSGSIGKISKHTLPIAIEWLEKHDVPFDEIIIGKPWCGYDGFYVDDRAIRPSEFIKYSFEEINQILDREKS